MPGSAGKHQETPGSAGKRRETPGPTAGAAPPSRQGSLSQPARRKCRPAPRGSVVRAGHGRGRGPRTGTSTGTGTAGRGPHGGTGTAGRYRASRPTVERPGLSFAGTVLGQRWPCGAGYSFSVLRSGPRCAAPHGAFPPGCGVWCGEHCLTIAQVHVQTLGLGVSKRFPLSAKRVPRKSSRVLLLRGEE